MLDVAAHCFGTLEWLDDDQVLYGLRLPGIGVTDTWSVPADGSGEPSLFIPRAASAVVIEG